MKWTIVNRKIFIVGAIRKGKFTAMAVINDNTLSLAVYKLLIREVKMKKIIVFLLCLTGFVPAYGAKFQTLDEALTETATKIAQNSFIPKNTKIAVVGFLESTSRFRYPLSSVLEDDLSGFLIEKMPGRVIAKNHIETVLRELKITRDDIFDTRNRKQFGRLASADLIVSGNYWINRREVIIVVNVVNIESGLAFFSHRVRIRKSQLDKHLLNSENKYK